MGNAIALETERGNHIGEELEWGRARKWKARVVQSRVGEIYRLKELKW